MLELSKIASKKIGRNLERKGFDLNKLSLKSSDFLKNSTAHINICHGAVRSGKTISSTLRWLIFMGESHHTDFLQSGKTWRSLYRNVLRDEMSMLDTMNIPYVLNKSEGTLTIGDNTIWLIGFRDERVSDVIRGMTIAGWYADETNTYPQSAVEEALDRCSLEGARVFWTMNPDNPYHYIYTDYITNKTLLECGDVRVWHYTLDDNPNIPQSYISQIKRRYKPGSVQYKRKVLGLWVVAEGVIYDRFIEASHVFSGRVYDYHNYVISVDYGPGNVSVAGLFGINRTDGGNVYHLLDEFYYDVQVHNRQLTDEEFADRALTLLKREDGTELPLTSFFTPHDASSLRATLKKRYYQGQPLPVKTYTPNTLNDIYEIQRLIVEDRFMIHEGCVDSISQVQSYSWDPKSQLRGEDRPLKVNDHCPDMWRAALLGTRLGGVGVYRTSTRRFDYA